MNHPYIPYFQTSRYRVDTMIELAEIKRGEKAADLGSGDGRIVIALARAGAEAHGYELDEQLVKLSQKNISSSLVIPANLACRQAGAGIQKIKRGSITIHQIDFWQEDLSQYNIICIYPMPDIMEALEQKLQKELKPGTRVLLNYYPFPHWQATKAKDHIYLYTLERKM